ncbi:unnamed protein product [Peronospora destructor]|uniref:Calcineurin-like phosphoesterase domain-containing protein n=1 Tax=Peronospora destructor TaxID=86335 RepID=A0AAV0V0K2_9STRA|nr:unnamed protein product [Peronospora destructor]
MLLERAHPDVALPLVLHYLATDVPASTRVLVIVFVGDLVNKGPKSLEVVLFVRDSDSLCVRGNHEDAALSAYYNWVHGGRVPGTAKYPYVELLEIDDVKFLEQLPFSLSLPYHNNVIVVHAGVVPEVEIKDQRPFDLYKIRLVQREKAGDEVSKWKALEKEKFKTSAGLQQESFATGLDTGCCYGRKLTACVIPSNNFMQIHAKKQYEVPSGDKD